MSTAPQRERSDMAKVPRRLRARSHKLHSATTRAIRCAQHDDKVARAISQFARRCNQSDPRCAKSRESCASCAILRNRNAHGHLTRACLCGKGYQPRRYETTSNEHPALTATVNPKCGHTVCGNKQRKKSREGCHGYVTCHHEKGESI